METGGAVETSYEHDDGEECQSKLASLYEFHQDSPQPAGEDNEAAGEIERIEGDGAEVEDDRPAFDRFSKQVDCRAGRRESQKEVHDGLLGFEKRRPTAHQSVPAVRCGLREGRSR